MGREMWQGVVQACSGTREGRWALHSDHITQEWSGWGRRGETPSPFSSLLDHTCQCISVVTDRCPLSRQLLTGGSAAAQLFLTAPRKRNILRQYIHVCSWEKQAGCLTQGLLEHWFCPRFQTNLSTGRAVGAAVTRWWAIRGTLAGQRLPPWHLGLEEVMFEHSLYPCEIRKRESEVARYVCWRKPDDSVHRTDIHSLQISLEFGLCSSSCSSDSVEDCRGRQTSKKTFWIPLCKWLYFALMKEWIWWPSKSPLTHDTVILHGCGWCSRPCLDYPTTLLLCSLRG